MNDSLTPLAGTVPLSAGLGIFAWQLLKAPFELYRELQEASAIGADDLRRQVELVEQRATVAEDALKDYRNYKDIADVLTKHHEYGVHQILNVPPNDPNDALTEWNRWVYNWDERLFLDMEKLGCTLQEITYVKTIAITEVTAGLPEPVAGWGRSANMRERFLERVEMWNAEARRKIEIPIRMHAIRLDRLAEVSTKYAQLAESMRSQARK